MKLRETLIGLFVVGMAAHGAIAQSFRCNYGGPCIGENVRPEDLVTTAGGSADLHASIITVRKACGGAANCWESLHDAVCWTWNCRHPDAASPLLIDIGPGTWSAPPCVGGGSEENASNLECAAAWCPDGQGHVTFRGAGRGITIIENKHANEAGEELRFSGQAAAGVAVTNCNSLVFDSLTIRSYSVGVWWDPSGGATWTDVEILGGLYGYYDNGVASSLPNSLHYWSGCRVSAEQTEPEEPGGLVLDDIDVGLFSASSEHWFFGGEIHATPSNRPGMSTLAGVIATSVSPSCETGPHPPNHGDVRLFGTTVRVRTQPTARTHVNGLMVCGGATGGAVGINIGPHAHVHSHGGVVNVDSSSSLAATNAAAVKAHAASSTHAPGTAFIVNAAAGGLPKRIEVVPVLPAAMVDAPFEWGARMSPPADASGVRVASLHGQDMYVEMDCTGTGCCRNGGGGTQPHLMVYSNACTLDGPWFDVVTGRCRSSPPVGSCTLGD